MPIPIWWPGILLGWPSAPVGAGLLLLGGLTRKAWLAGLGALASAGFCLCLALYPLPFRLLAPLSLVCNLLFVVSVRRGVRALSSLWLLPFLALIGNLAYLVQSS